MLWSEKQTAKGIRLELGWFAPRKCWRKYSQGVRTYFHQPNTADGYRRPARPCCSRSCHTGWQRHRRQDEAHSCRTACRSCRHRMDAASDHGLRVDEDPQGQRQTAGDSTNACPAIQGVAKPLSSWAKGRGRLPAQEGVGGRQLNWWLSSRQAVVTILAVRLGNRRLGDLLRHQQMIDEGFGPSIGFVEQADARRSRRATRSANSIINGPQISVRQSAVSG